MNNMGRKANERSGSRSGRPSVPEQARGVTLSERETQDNLRTLVRDALPGVPSEFRIRTIERITHKEKSKEEEAEEEQIEYVYEVYHIRDAKTVLHRIGHKSLAVNWIIHEEIRLSEIQGVR